MLLLSGQKVHLLPGFMPLESFIHIFVFKFKNQVVGNVHKFRISVVNVLMLVRAISTIELEERAANGISQAG